MAHATEQVQLVRVNRGVVVGLFALGLFLAYTLGGSFLHDLAEGIQRSQLPLWKIFVPLGVLLGAVAAMMVRWKQPTGVLNTGFPGALLSVIPTPQSEDILATDPSRRAVLRSLGSVGAGVAAASAGLVSAVGRNSGWLPVANDFFLKDVEKSAPNFQEEWTDATIVNYRRLGRTNEMVSDISLGSARIDDVNVARRAIDAGINYFDTAPDYSHYRSENVLGEAIQGRRDKVFLATKFCVADGHLPNDTPVPKVIETVEASLKRLKTDYVDLVHIHSCDRLDRLMAPNIHEAFDRLKEQGKARFLGVSTHTPNLEEVANAAIDSGRFDVMMLAYHYGMWPQFGHIVDKAKEHDVGVVAMKTLKGAMHTNLADFREERTSYTQAAFRWVLSNPSVSCLVVSMHTQKQVDEYVAASGLTPNETDLALLRKYDQLISGDYCQPHCGECLDSCTAGLAVNDILRHRMYFKDYGDQKTAMELYAKLERNASACIGCDAPCQHTCPSGVPIQAKLADAHRLLTFAA